MALAGEGVARGERGRGMGGRGKLAALNERRAALQGQADAILNERAELDASLSIVLPGNLRFHVGSAGGVQVYFGLLGQSITPENTLRIRDHLCDVLGLPERFQDVTTLTTQEAEALAERLVRHRTIAVRSDGASEILRCDAAKAAIMDALDHAGVIQSDTTATPSATRQADGGKADATTKPQASAPAAGTAGSAQNHNTPSFPYGLPLVNLGPGGDHTREITGDDINRAIAVMRSVVDQFTALIYRLTNHDKPSKPGSPSIDLKA